MPCGGISKVYNLFGYSYPAICTVQVFAWQLKRVLTQFEALTITPLFEPFFPHWIKNVKERKEGPWER